MARRRGGAEARPLRARAAAVALPRASPGAGISRFVPSGRSLAAGFGIVALAAGAYAVARESSAFAVDRITVAGAPTHVRKDVKYALASLRGTSLLALDGNALRDRVESLPSVVSLTYDRGFPHTLRLVVVPERPVAVLHRGKDTWLVSARGRVVRRVPNRTHGGLARIWVPRATSVEVGAFLDPDRGGALARTLALASRFPARIAVASLTHGELVYKLRAGLDLRLGEPTDVRLKLAIARRALSRLPAGTAYLDLSVPERPVAGPANPQVSGRD